MARGTALGVLPVALGLALGSCSRAEKPVLDRVQLELAGSDDSSILGQTEGELQAALETALKASGFRSAADVKEVKPGWRVDAALMLAEVKAADMEAPARTKVALVLSRKGDDTDREVVGKGEAKVKGPGLDERRDAARAATQLALEDASHAAVLLISLLGKTDAELIAQKEGRARDFSLTLLAERKNGAALEPLLQKLKSDDLDEVRRAIGGLLELKDQRAVAPLIEASRARDDMFQREIVFALGALGGDEAEAYLQIITEGHDVPLMRASAQQALEELRRRRDGGLLPKRGVP